ncbi:erythrocyte membrane protein 1, PfEMP1 [Plasmodium sp. gorilla clade G1]|nr:erythrocyte membrane protein 1, PfEMP1 [Plasmodium sp. gorilla clade G1]
MAPQGRGGGGASGSRSASVPSTSTTYSSAKDLLEDIGKSIQEEAHTEAEKRGNELRGDLSQAKFNDQKNTITKPCDLDYTIHTNVAAAAKNRDPCHRREKERFSDERSGQCTYNRIRDSGNNNNVGACAPYRRLNICDYNLENIDAEKITNAHNLLADVLLVAQHEGKSLVEEYAKYEKYDKSNYESRICTVLARSFADIGDIIRGKDLYLGNKKRKEKQREKEKLEIKLRTFFNNIYNNLTKEAKQKYEDDGNYFKLREDWWALNRDQVWKAITCIAPVNANYFVYKSDGYRYFTNEGYCGRDEKNVPTNLDYVPQFLRWFDEWADDFCRKRNIKLKMTKEACRNHLENLYCSHNGYDCTKLIRNKHACSREFKCTGCSTKCKIYEHWLSNQRNELKKQNKKYDKEIKTYSSKKGISNSNINTEYYKNFYHELKDKYKNPKDFLKLLNIGKYCKEGLEGEKDIDFTITGDKDAFDRSEYCQVCPDCVVECDHEKCEPKKDNMGKCVKTQIYTRIQNLIPTQIKVLFSGDNQKDITEILSSFCSNQEKETDTNYQKWKCYYKNSDDNNCEMNISSYKDAKDPNIMISDECFHLWVRNLLIDTIKWETELKNCINNTNVTDCENECNNNCKCYEKWINTKETEWENVKKVYENQNETLNIYYNKLNGLFDRFLFQVMYELNKGEKGKWNQFTEVLKKKMDYSKENASTENSKNEIELLFDHLKENATTCIDNNSLESGEKCKKKEKNPCPKSNDATQPTKTVKQLAELKQQDTREQLEEGGVGETKLKGDASKGKYDRGGDPDGFKKDKLCEITKDHSNRNDRESKEPCGGKDGSNERFKIGTVWKHGDYVNTKYPEVYLPPRREHMCTSNLEFLETGDGPLNRSDGKLVNNSFLGDVMLSAKMDADKIIELYKNQNSIQDLKHAKDQETVCRAIKYSFADIGDIIRGRDMWDHKDQKTKVQEYLVKVFEKIKDQLPGIKEKYDGDEDNKTPYKLLREDWWEANRHQVWRAMKCATKNINNNKCKGIPIEDYIPQRLRWMTEWAEWYCKFKSKAYEEVKEQCKKCMDKVNGGKKCNKDTPECANCESECEVYINKIDPWKKQWRELERQYRKLYAEAKITAGKGGPDYYTAPVQEEDKHVIEFLYNLYRYNGGKVGASSSTESTRPKRSISDTKTAYDNVGSYLYDTWDFTNCKDPTEFCDSGRTIIQPSRPPQPQPPAPAPEEKEKPPSCDTVDKLLNKKKETDDIESCKQKDKNGKYPPWKNNSDLVEDRHVWMPPRRQKLCVYFFAGQKVIDDKKIKNQNDLKEAFIKSAAAEMFFAWHYYKKKNDNAETQLQAGNIPPEFLRSMFYTYGDYRDFVFGTDISTGHGKKSQLKTQIDNLFPKNGVSKNSGHLSRKDWWQKYGPEVWNGMLCALQQFGANKETLTKNYPYPNVTFTSGETNSPTLETFAQRPQFLRWFTEWSDEFCREREKLEKVVERDCTSDYEGCENNKNGDCFKACEAYKKYITDKKEEYTSQAKKFNTDKTQNEKEYKDYSSKEASEYLKDKCFLHTCSCMDKVKNNTEYWKYPHKTYDEKTLENRCECELQPPPPKEKAIETPLSCVEKVAKQLREEAERKVNGELKGTGLVLNGKCNNVKKENGAPANGENSCDFKTIYENSVQKITKTCERIGMNRLKIEQEWNCKYIKDIGKHLCIPPRRKDICLKGLSNVGKYNVNNSTDLLQKLQEIAQHEGDDIIRKLLEQNSCDEHRICDAMKYSFADLADIIRGRDLLIRDGEQGRIKKKFTNLFTKIYSNLKGSKKKKYQNDITNLYELRSDWWDANRREIWKAMTCNAPDAAKLNKRSEEPQGISTDAPYISTLKNCGYEKDPPDYDYIPQPFRWMQEWSENFCKLLNTEMEQFETHCEDCKDNGTSCKGDNNGKKCEKCKTQCENYKKLFDKWKLQFNKYKETYNEIYNNKAKISSEDYVKNFLKELKAECKEENTADKYLDEASHCKKYKFTNHSESNNNDNYAFKNPPKDFDQACKCDAPDPLDQCPDTEEKKEVCTKLSITDECSEKRYNNYLDNWDSSSVEHFTGKNKGVLVPPRRSHLCLRNITLNLSTIRTKEDFKKNLIQSAYTEAYLLSKKYNVQEKALQAMKYSFADYGDIVKGTDMMDNYVLNKLKTKIHDLLNDTANNEPSAYREKWWEENKHYIWHAMLCGYKTQKGYKSLNSTWCSLPAEDKTHQFMRWFQEWIESFCTRRKQLYDIMVNKCKEAECDVTTGRMSIPECTQACREYENYILQKKQEYFGQLKKYDNEFKDLHDNKDAPYYFKSTFFTTNYDCLYDNFNEKNKWENPYESLKIEELKGKCNCKEKVIPIVPKEKDVHPKHDEKPKPPVPDTRPAPPSLPPSDEPFDPTILQTSIPFGVALALGSIAFLFLKKKTQAPVDLFSVINIPKGDYDIPTLKSSNRYIPYASDRYKGKTYIYMEGDSSGDEKYAFMSDTTDITSSESEYEELDINDIYVPGSPKYKTLIEVVLEPSKRDIQSDDIPHTNKFTDEEWNQLKHDFISNMLQNQPNDVPNDYKIGNVTLNTQPNTLYFDNNQEKPFITSIHDRNLYSGEEYNYNVNMVNSMNDIPINRDNNVYSGIDLINDSLNNNNVDIYDELLKRKENELFGTNHPKHTNTHNVTKSSNSDPIDNQLDLFHTWLDRHRDMCEQWNNKEELLDKLKEEWNKDNNTGDIPSDSNKTLNTDVSIQIHMDNPKPINEFTNMDTILEDLEKYNEPYYDVQDDIYYDVNDHDVSTVDSNAMDVPSKVQIEMDINTKLVKEKYPIADVWDI